MKLSDFELSIFRYIHDNPNCSAISLLNLFEQNGERRMAVQKLVEMHIQKGHIKRNGLSFDSNMLDLTAPGFSLMLLNEDMREKEAQDKRDKAFDRKLNVASVLVPAITFVLGLLVEHYSGILGWLAKAIESLG